jgi:hypothetical protein
MLRMNGYTSVIEIIVKVANSSNKGSINRIFVYNISEKKEGY